MVGPNKVVTGVIAAGAYIFGLVMATIALGLLVRLGLFVAGVS